MSQILSLGSVQYLIFINDLTKKPQSNPKLFAGYTLLLSMIYDPENTAKQLFLSMEDEWMDAFVENEL